MCAQRRSRQAVQASCSSVEREINRERASLVTPEICRGFGAAYARGAAVVAGEMRSGGEALLSFAATICLFFCSVPMKEEN